MLEKYITPVLMYYLQKYVKNIQPQDLQLSFWGGDAVLKNLQLRCDVLEDELSHLPFVVTAGKIQDLTIHVPWTTLGSEPVEITAANIDCSATFKNDEQSRDERPKDAQQGLSQMVETPDGDDQKQTVPQAQPPSAGYLQGLLSRIIHNVVFHIKNLSVRIIDVDICVTLHIKGLEYHNTNEQWNTQFIYSDYLQGDYTTHSQCDVSDMYVTLDQLSGGGQVEEYEDPLTSNFALIVRMMSTYRKNVLKGKRLEFWCTCLDFSVTPRQFCLLSRLLDRVLALYYSSKRHRIVGGADNATPPADAAKMDDSSSGEAWITAESNEKEHMEEEVVSSTLNVDGGEVDSSSKKEKEEKEGDEAQTSWSQWAMSFVVSPGDPSKQDEEGEEKEDGSATVITIPPASEVPQEPSSFQLLILVDELTFTFKTTQQASSQTFFSAQKHRSLPVLRAAFKGGIFRMHTDPLTQFFGVYQGFVGAEAHLIGGCMCSKFQNEMQDGNLNGNGIQQLDSLNESMVFRAGPVGTAKPVVSSGSLFDPKWSAKDATRDEDLSLRLCPSEAFSALWCAYEYYDVGEGREKEECSEVVRVGGAEGVLCPEVTHWYNHLSESLTSSLEANPWRSANYIVLGDPSARTHVGLHFSPSVLTLSANCHGSLSLVSQADLACVTRGSHFVLSMEAWSLEGTVPMYVGNASDDRVQHTSLQVEIPSLTLCVPPKEATSCPPLIAATHLTVNYHSQDRGAETGRWYLQFEGQEVTFTAEPGVLTSTAAVVHSWRHPCDWSGGRVTPRVGVSHDSLDPPASTFSDVVTISIGNSSLELNSGEECYTRTFFIGQMVGHLKGMRSEASKTLPLLLGPIDSSTMTTPDGLSGFAKGRSEDYMESEGLVELFTSEPLNEDKDTKFATVKMKASGALFFVSAETLSVVSQLVSVVTDMIQPVAEEEEEEEKDDGDDRVPCPPPLAVSEHFPPSFVSTRSGWLSQQPLVLGMPAPWVARTVASQISNLSEEERTESSPHKDLLSNKGEEKEHPVVAKDTGKEDTPPISWISQLRSTVLEVNTKPIIVVLTSEVPPSWGASPRGCPSAVGESPLSHIKQLQSQLMVLATQEERGLGEGDTGGDAVPTSQAIVFALPQLLLGSAISEAASLSEPISKEGGRDSWPWQLQASDLSVYTFDGNKQHHIVKPAACEVTLTAVAQQATPAESSTVGKGDTANSLAVHTNFQPLIVSVSRHQLELIRTAISALQYAFLTQPTPSSDSHINLGQTPDASVMDPALLGTPSQSVAAGALSPAHLPSPALSVVSIATFPPGGSRSNEGSTTHSKRPSEGLRPRMLLWIQCAVPKVTVRIYSVEECGREKKLEVSGENLVVSWDQQKAVCEGHLSLTSLDAVFLQRSTQHDADWQPAVLEGLLFSSHSPVLGRNLSASVAQEMSLFERHLPSPISARTASPHRTSPLHFITIGLKAYGAEAPHKPSKLSLAVQPFEVLLWWPVADIFTELANAFSVGGHHGNQRVTQEEESIVPPKWPSLQLCTDAFRLLLPNKDASKLIALQADAIAGTSSLDTNPIRYVVNESAYHKVKASVRDRQRPRLAAYQMELASLSLWGCVHSEESEVELFPLVAKATLRLLHCPSVTLLPVDQFPFAGSKFKPILACGNSVEANLTSDLSVLVTPPGAELIGEISSFLGSINSRHPAPSNDATATSMHQSETYQITLTGQTCSVAMVTSPADSERPNMATPLVLLTLQNPVAMHKSCNNQTTSSFSLLNVACSCAEKIKLVHLPEVFQSTGLTKAKFFPKIVMETRQGLPLKDTSGVSPSFLALNYTHCHTAPSQGTRTPARQPALTVDCGRPVKIALSQLTVERVSALLSLLQCRLKGTDKKEPAVAEMNSSEGTGEGVSTKHVEEHGIGAPAAEDPIGQEESCDHKWGVSVSANQLLFEYSGTHEHSSVGVACGWEELKACPSVDGSLTARFSSCWLEVKDGEAAHSSYLVLPTSLTLRLSCHPQQSQLDGHYMMVGVSIPILQLRLSLHQLHALRSVLDSMFPSNGKENEGEGSRRVEGDRESQGKEEDATKETKVLVFQDDLRIGSLTVADQPGEGGYSFPPPGLIWFFPGGGDDTMPAMTWHYHEPRRLTQIHTMPLPFDVSMATESGNVDLSLGCLLQYYDEDCKEFVTAHRFHLSESTSTRLHIDPTSSSFSTIWRVCIQEVEWGDTDRSTTERLSELVKDGVSAVVSPTALAGCLRVDSVYTATSIPTSALDLDIGTLDVTLLNHCHTEGTRVGEFSLQTSASASGSCSVEEEVFQFVVQSTLGRVKSLQGGGSSVFLAMNRVDGKFVDFQQETWKHCLCASNFNFKFVKFHEPLFNSQFSSVPEGPRTLGSSNGPSVLHANLNIDTILFDVSASLAHSVAIASKTWFEKKIPQAAIFQHYIIFNNTLEDIYFGQTGTDEVIMIQVRGCRGYSWKRIHGNHKQLLHASLGSKAGWRWTKPFSVDKEGLQCVEVCAADRQLAYLYVRVERSGGCQLMITFLGNWFFTSLLPVNLQFKIEAVVSSQAVFRSRGRDQAEAGNPAPVDLMGMFPAHSSLPSCLASDSCFSGVSFAGVQVEPQGVWSDLLPLATSKDNWSKPHILAKIPLASDADTVECWYSVRQMEPIIRQPSPAKVTLAPLFGVRSYLPFDVDLRLLPQPLSASVRSEVFEVPGHGEYSVLLGAKVDVEYHVTVCFEEGTFAALDGQPFSISTKLLNTLPLLEEVPRVCEDSSEGTEWVDRILTSPQTPGTANTTNWNSGPEVTCELAPVTDKAISEEKCPPGRIIATLSRTSVGTLVIDLRPRYLLLNKLPLELRVVYPRKGGEGQLYEGKQQMVAMETDSCCIMQESEFSLAVSWSSQSSLTSGLLSATEPLSQAKRQPFSSDSPSPCATEQVSLTGLKGLMAVVSVQYKQVGLTTVVTVKPQYYVHNRSKYKVQVSPFRLSSKALLDFSYEDLHPLTVMQPDSSSALVYWQLFGSEHPLQAVSLSASGDMFSWSIPLSLRFVRHSFALPVTEHVGATIPAVLTSHEHADGTVHLVLSSDPVPRVLVQNLCRFPVEVVESGTRGIHAVPLTLHPGHQSAYEPPTMAKVYPMILGGEEEESEISTLLGERLKNLSLRLRDSSDKLPGHLNLGGPITPSSRTSSFSSLSGGHSWTEEEWSSPISLELVHDQSIQFTSGRRCFITAHQRPHCIQITILPTGQGEESLPMLPMSDQEAENESRPQKSTFQAEVKVISVSLQDAPKKTQNVIALTSEGLAIKYSKDELGNKNEGGRLEVTMKSLQVDNELQEPSCEYAVVALPHRKAEWQATLFKPKEVPLVSLTVDFHCSISHCIRHLSLRTQPMLLQVEDAMLGKLRSLSGHFVPPSILPSSPISGKGVEMCQGTPTEVLLEADRDRFPLMVEHLEIKPLDLHINARATVRMFLSCDDLPLKFTPYNQSNVFSNWHEMSQVIAAHYVAGAVWKVGWAVGSLEILGSPATLVRSIGRGVRDFFSIPYEGITRSPAYFIWGLGQGSASLIRNVTSGTIRSVTSFTASISRNMEQLSMDQRHTQELQQYRSQYQTQQQRGGSLATGLLGGITTFGHSLVSAVRGVVDQPLQEVERRRVSSGEDSQQQQHSQQGIGDTAKDIITGVGKGVVGVVTKPVGGAMELVTHSGQGIIYGFGLSPSIIHSAVRREQTAELGYPEAEHNSLMNLLDPTACSSPEVVITASTAQTVDGPKQASLLVLSSGVLMVYPKTASSTTPHQSFSLTECHIEMVHDTEAVSQEKGDGGDEQVETVKNGRGEEVVLRVTDGKPVHSLDSVFASGGEQQADPLLSWRISAPPFPSPPEGDQGTSREEESSYQDGSAIGSLEPILHLAPTSAGNMAPTSAGKVKLFIFCSGPAATHLLKLVYLTQLHVAHGHTFFFST